MSLARGKFGIEYNPRQMEPESSGFGWLVVAVALAALVSLSWVIVKRIRSAEPVPETIEIAAATPAAPPPVPAPPRAVTNEPPPAVVRDTEFSRRPPKLRNLLMRLEEAEKRRDIEMAVTTIESIRALPGSPAADLDDALARRLGTLNLRRLFEVRSAQWVKTVTVGRGDSASRLAVENGSTVASLARLNGGSVETIRLGAKLYVMDHPRFSLVLRRRPRIADLSLNGKFFKRYDLRGGVRAKDGSYEVPERRKALWDMLGEVFAPRDRDELEMLLPRGAPVLVSEF